jgi:hypothetical protein
MALMNDLRRIGFVLRLALEGEDVGGLAVGDFVDSTITIRMRMQL